jgi:hypothetical protein
MRTSILAAFFTVLVAAAAAAQEPPPPPKNPPPAPSSFTNIRLDLTITDTYADTPSTKTVTMLVMDRARGSIRTQNRLANGPGVLLNMDAAVDLLPPPSGSGRIQLLLTFEYTPVQAEGAAETRAVPAQLTESLTVVLQDGQKLMISQSADPVTDRKVTVEVTATVLR